MVGEPKPISHPVKFFEKGDKPARDRLDRQWYIKNGGRDRDLADQLISARKEKSSFTRHSCGCASKTGSMASTATGLSHASASSEFRFRFGTA
jgi:hypothetical protein